MIKQYFKINNKQEIEYNLNTTNGNPNNFSVISGIVKDQSGLPIEGATVKLFTANLTPHLHYVTKPDGRFLFNSIKPGSYHITVVSNIHNITGFDKITLLENINHVHNFTLNTVAKLSVVEGWVFNNNNPQKNVNVMLQSVDKTYFVKSDNYGQYIFYDILPGNYKLYAQNKAQISKIIYLQIIGPVIINYNLKF